MKKNLLVAAAVLSTLLLEGNSMAPQPLSTLKSAVINVQPSTQLLLNYTWYNDQWLTDPTGTYSGVSAELERLRDLYSGYVFSSSPGMGLYQFEYGHFPYYPTYIIYSNLR